MRYKVEIYVETMDDAQQIIDMVDSHFNGISNKKFYELPGEFGIVDVKHLHYQLDTIHRDERQK